ncbi:tRNA(adenine(34)) deaminase, chloroplastic isoform X2 [Spinacia oleracea]|uniref:tRNA(Adenine(34)) deaminase, chloroplastic isoform X2 n=1 Tax=Spinacia oleracea TaxID=3562 RepID=A0A9R0IGD9_SPIOL|nr:tRNA(adenine(34)) deaminase, chloroplastic isoform X2 [Spinacia oleracea]
MMHTTYSSSSIISLSTYSTLNYYSYCSIEKCSSTYCSCCCSFPINSCKLIVPTNPRFLCGLRQSTLIQCPPSRRFTLGSSDRYCCRSPTYDVGRCCCSESSCVKKERVGGFNGKNCNEKCCVKQKRGIDVSKIKGRMGWSMRDFRSSALGDAEAMLSLLSEGMIEERVVDREKRSSPLEGKVAIDKFKDRKPNVAIDKFKDRKPNVAIDKFKGRKPDVGSGYRESETRNRKLETGRVQAREEGHKRDEEKQIISKDEDGRLRRRESSSSYYSLSDSGDFGSDVEVEIEKDEFVGESSTSHNKDLRKNEMTKHNWERYRDEKDQELQSSNDFRVGGSIQQNWRKKSEKKFTQDYKETNSNVRQSQERSYMIDSSSKKQLNYQQEQSTTSDVKSLGLSSSHIHKDNRASQLDYSTQTNNRGTLESTSNTWRRSTQGDLNSVEETGCKYCKTCGTNMETSKTQSDFQQHAELTEMSAKLTSGAESLSEDTQKNLTSHQISAEDVGKKHDQIHLVTGQSNAERKSQHCPETLSTDATRAQSTLSRRRKEEESSSSLQISAQENKQQDDEIYLENGQVDARRKFHHYTDASYSQSTFREQQQSEARMKYLEEKTAALVAAEEVKRLREESGGKVPHVEIGDSGVHSSNLETRSHSTSDDERVYNLQTYSKSKVKSVEELVEKRKWIDETTVQSTLRTEIQGPASGNFPGEGTVSQPSIPLMSRTGIQQLSREEVRSGLVSMTSPPFQDVSRSQFHDASRNSLRNDTGRTGEVGSGSSDKLPQERTPSSHGEVYDRKSTFSEEYTHGDALVSAACMQESSTLIVDEFIEKLSVEGSTSETSTEKKLAKLDLKHQDKKHMLKGPTESESDKTGLQKKALEHPSQVSSPNFKKKKPQKLDSKRSSVDSETKGSSDQMWDVKDHFVQEASEMESLEGAISGSIPVVSKGNSVWSTVAGICKLRWGSHSENQKSPVKVKVQASPSGSAGGESWFSGNEADEPNGDGMTMEHLSSPHQTASSDKQLLETSSSQNEDVVVMNLDDKLSHVHAGTSSSSSALHSSSISGDVLVGGNTNLSIPQFISLPSPSVGLSEHSVNLNAPQLMSLPSHSVDLSKPSSSQLRRLHTSEEIVDTRKKRSFNVAR